jgi:hypothetical protein
MIKILYTILFVLIACSGFSQIPNSGFENWTNMGTYDNPNSWGTMNNTTVSSGIYTVIKGTPGSPGIACIKLISQTDGNKRSVINGIAVSGILDSTTQMPKSGFPFSQRPQSLTGNWQHMTYGSGSGFISALLTQWNTSSNKRDTVAFANLPLGGMVMSWTAFSINFSYQSSVNPDTCIIVLSASGSSPTQNDYLWVDNLAFSGLVTGVSESPDQNIALNIFPNPANNEVEFTNSKAIHNGDILIISDMLGNEIFRKKINEDSFKINTSNFANGTYICKMVNSYNVQYFITKFTIQH